jgi:hypothetical protein
MGAGEGKNLDINVVSWGKRRYSTMMKAQVVLKL